MLGFNPNELIEKIEAEQKETNGLKYFDVNRKYSYSIGKNQSSYKYTCK